MTVRHVHMIEVLTTVVKTIKYHFPQKLEHTTE